MLESLLKRVVWWHPLIPSFFLTILVVSADMVQNLLFFAGFYVVIYLFLYFLKYRPCCH